MYLSYGAQYTPLSKTSDTKPSNSKGWDALWNEYNDLLKQWGKDYEAIQKTSSDIQQKYMEIMQKGVQESNPSTIQDFYRNWQKSVEDSGVNTYKQFVEDWQKLTNKAGMEQLESYGDMMNKFADTWKRMWRSS